MTKPKRDWQEFFKPEDFNGITHPYVTDFNLLDTVVVAHNANALIRGALEELPVMYGCKGSDDRWYMDEREDRRGCPAYSHTAKLVDVREIK
jgi:hypothetical protein